MPEDLSKEWADVPTGQREALRLVRARLLREFAGLDAAIVGDTVLTSRDYLLSVPREHERSAAMVERFARDRLTAVAKLRGWRRAGPAVLFMCRNNAGQSQMARAFFTRFEHDHAVAWSGGSAPGTHVDPVVVQVMAERGIDIAEEFPKPWTAEFLQVADVVVDLGCGDTDPIVTGHRYEQWPIHDPAGQPIEQVRLIGAEIERRVRRLIYTLGLSCDQVG
ncbi:arsenate reductase/protein-tyrosine-phosphatase family protein [Nocardia jejuensis]|uniref:arsenate reductase/protein-tyrosine-phosphatase family protein n=1 Tax=Nocardia jejuensis TaxID=328049 RepID=UPI0008354969|nr:hypothetical protein [Nocardia jejuensis]